MPDAPSSSVILIANARTLVVPILLTNFAPDAWLFATRIVPSPSAATVIAPVIVCAIPSP